MGATPTGPTLDPLNILVNKFNIATHVALILFLFSSWINYLLYDTKSVMVFWQLLSKIKRFVTIFRISWNGPTLFNIPIGDFPPLFDNWKKKSLLSSICGPVLNICDLPGTWPRHNRKLRTPGRGHPWSEVHPRLYCVSTSRSLFGGTVYLQTPTHPHTHPNPNTHPASHTPTHKQMEKSRRYQHVSGKRKCLKHFAMQNNIGRIGNDWCAFYY